MEQDSKKEEIIKDYSSIEAFTRDGFKALVEATKASNALPTDRDWDFYKVHDSFTKVMNAEGDRVVCLMNSILRSQQITANIRNRDLEEKMELIIEANDDILEKAAIGIDDMNGIKRSVQEAVEIQAVSAQLPINGSWNQLNKATYSVSSSIDAAINESKSLKSIRLLTAKNIIRPQSFFKDSVDNSNTPWIPRITDKPNSLKPLAIFLEASEEGEAYSHPYEFELDHFKPLPEQLKEVTPVAPKPLDSTPLHEITTPEHLDDLVKELRKHSEFSVDLEHHSYRTFMGITCLMQISTKDADYLVDTISLRDKLCILNEVFTKPTIVKVFHGAVCDIEWLQRDLSLYVVNMFDTFQAAKHLQYASLSLAYLLNKFCGVVPNKHFQLADWRIRPLPDELKRYARMDTHYLLYIYQKLKNELLKKGNGSDNILRSVIQQSTQICKKRYVKPRLRDDSHLDFYRKCKRMFNNRQMYALKELYAWRDNLARAEDESTGYVLPNHMLLQISESLPREMQGILACCNPIPPLVRANLLELHRIIHRAREQSLEKPIMKEDNRSRGSTLQFTKVNVDSPLHCPHDLSKMSEYRDDLPVLLGDALKNVDRKDAPNRLEKAKSMYSVFNTLDNSDNEDETDAVLKMKSLTFLGPYERYKLVKPFIQAEEEKAAQERLEPETKADDTEDRIAALHAYFEEISKDAPQKKPGQGASAEEVTIVKEEPTSSETLVLMGGSKKRKRSEFELDEVGRLHPDHKVPPNELHTPVPIYETQKHPNKKRKGRFWRNKRTKNQQQQFNSPFVSDEQLNQSNQLSGSPSLTGNNSPQQPHNNKNKKKKRQRLYNRSHNHYNSLPHPGQFAQPNLPNSYNDRHKNNYQNKNELEQGQKPPKVSRQNFTPFDYSSVDFQQFQGGAGEAKRKPVKTQFKGKNKNKKFNKHSNNKSMTFSRGTH